LQDSMPAITRAIPVNLVKCIRSLGYYRVGPVMRSFAGEFSGHSLAMADGCRQQKYRICMELKTTFPLNTPIMVTILAMCGQGDCSNWYCVRAYSLASAQNWR
jgi:hypothetical protein